MKQPRDYQLEAVDSTFSYFQKWGADVSKNPLVAMPTGTGKSIVIAGTQITMLQHVDPSHCFLCLTHDSELVQQNTEELLEFWPDAPVGIHCASLGRRDTVQPIIFATVHSVHATLKKYGPAAFGTRHTVQIDEAHMIPQAEAAMYQQVFTALRSVNPYVRFVGYTATGFRMKQGLLTDGGLFSDFCFNATSLEAFNRFLTEGYLVPLVPKRTDTEINLAGVKLTAGDYNGKALEEASNVERISYGCVEEIVHAGYAQNRRKWLIFCAGIQHCESVARIVESFGVAVDYVHSERSAADNKKAIADFKQGSLRCMVNANKLTTGFNVPAVDLIGMMRGTMSPVLHVQMGGRGTRPYTCAEYTKQNCLFLDFVRNVPRLGPINDPIIPTKPGKKQDRPAPCKECTNCQTFNHTSARFCFYCYAPFEFNTLLTTQAGSVPVIADFEPEESQIWPVQSVYYRKQPLKTGGSALKVIYVSGYQQASKLVMLEKEGWIGSQARKWWDSRAVGVPHLAGILAPASADQALLSASQLAHAREIRVSKKPTEKYWKVNEEIF